MKFRIIEDQGLYFVQYKKWYHLRWRSVRWKILPPSKYVNVGLTLVDADEKFWYWKDSTRSQGEANKVYKRCLHLYGTK